MNRLTPIFILTVFIAGAVTVEAQFSASADLMSRYLWRGQLLAAGPVIQPGISYTTGTDKVGVDLGVWGSYGLHPNDGTEADLYTTLTFGEFSLTLTDYFFPSDIPFATTEASDNYFDYDNHVFEAGLSYAAAGKVPLSAALYYNFAGADEENSLYSKVAFQLTDPIELFVEAGSGWYSVEEEGDDDSFAIVGVGFTYSNSISISEKFALPLTGTFAINPDLEKIYLIIGMQISLNN